MCARAEGVCECVFCCGWKRDREGAPVKSGACPFIDIFTCESGDRLTVRGSTRSAWAVSSTRKVFSQRENIHIPAAAASAEMHCISLIRDDSK